MISRIEFIDLFKPYVCGQCKKLLTKFSYRKHFSGLAPYHFSDMSVSFYVDKNDTSFIKFIYCVVMGYIRYEKAYFFRIPEDVSLLRIINKYLDASTRKIAITHRDDEKQFITDVMNYLDRCSRDIGEIYNLK